MRSGAAFPYNQYLPAPFQECGSYRTVASYVSIQFFSPEVTSCLGHRGFFGIRDADARSNRERRQMSGTVSGLHLATLVETDHANDNETQRGIESD